MTTRDLPEHMREEATQILAEAEQRLLELTGRGVHLTMNTTDTLKTLRPIVAKATGVPLELIGSRTRKGPVCTARHLYCYIAHRFLGLSEANIAKSIRRERTTVVHSIYTVHDRLRLGDEATVEAMAAFWGLYFKKEKI